MQNLTKYSFKFLIKLSFNLEQTKLTKLAQTLNQLNIEDSSQLDELLQQFFNSTNILKNLSLKNFNCNVYLVCWRNKNFYNFVKITPINLDFFIKNNFFFKGKKFDKNLKKFKKKLFTILFLQNYNFYGDWGFFFNLKSFCFNSKNLIGYLYSYSARSKMLGRQTNFRRKVKKKKFEDY